MLNIMFLMFFLVMKIIIFEIFLVDFSVSNT